MHASRTAHPLLGPGRTHYYVADKMARGSSPRPSLHVSQYQSPSGTAPNGTAPHSKCHPAPHPSHNNMRAAPVDLRHHVHEKLGGGTATLGSTRSSMSTRWHGAHRSMCTLTVLASDPSSSSTPLGATFFTPSIRAPALVSSVSTISLCRYTNSPTASGTT